MTATPYTPPHPLPHIAQPLVNWYRQNKRNLPWRENPTPYEVWVSEIMLQQTRVEAVKPYYARFLSALPTVRDLAEAEENTLLKLWEGLGYYSRVRNMQKAAKEICLNFGGELPADYQKLLSLTGIGPYTAGAISAFAFGLPEPAVDGNVLRVVARLTADGRNVLEQSTKNDMEKAVKSVIPPDFSSDFGQGLIELGATLCLPGRGEVHCRECPLRDLCLSYAQGLTEILPIRHKAQNRRTEQRTVLILETPKGILLCKRPQKGLLAGLWEFPNVLGHLTENEAEEYVRSLGGHILQITPLPSAKHIFTHITWEMTGYSVYADTLSLPPNALWAKRGATADYAIPSAFSAYKKYAL